MPRAGKPGGDGHDEEERIPRYVIEREVPGSMSQEDLRDLSQTSCNVLIGMGAQVHPTRAR